MKHKWLKIGVFLLTIGIIGMVYMGTVQSKVNINRMTSADWQDSHVAGIGEATQAKLLINAPYADIRDTGKIEGIGAQKQIQIERHFTTRDTCRWEDFIILTCIFLALALAGALIIFAIQTRRNKTVGLLMDLTKKK